MKGIIMGTLARTCNRHRLMNYKNEGQQKTQDLPALTSTVYGIELGVSINPGVLSGLQGRIRPVRKMVVCLLKSPD